MKHTPGPWWSTCQSDNRRAVRDKGGLICTLKRVTRFSEQEDRYEKELDECKANANLIVAAPELLNALMMARARIITESITSKDKLMKMINEAIKKATS